MEAELPLVWSLFVIHMAFNVVTAGKKIKNQKVECHRQFPDFGSDFVEQYR